MKNTAILLVSCPDQKGLNAAIHDFIYRANGNTLHADEHQDAERNLFLMRVEWDLADFTLDMREFAKHFQPIADRFGMQVARGAFQLSPESRDLRFALRSLPGGFALSPAQRRAGLRNSADHQQSRGRAALG